MEVTCISWWDFPDDENVQCVAREVYESGGVVSAVCHGLAVVVNVKLSDGSLLVEGRDVTGFTNAEERRFRHRASTRARGSMGSRVPRLCDF